MYYISKPVAIVGGLTALCAVAVIAWLAFFHVQGKDDLTAICIISVNNDIGDPQPLLLKPNGSDYDPFYLPSDGKSDNILLHHNDIVHVFCPGGKLLINSIATTLSNVTATCVKDQQFRVLDRDVQFSALNCTVYPEHVARYTGASCGGGFREIEIGFLVGSRFLAQIIACFDDVAQNAVYTWFNLTSKIAGYQSKFPRPTTFLQSDFYTVNGVDRLYTRYSQRSTINTLLGLPKNDTRYVHPTDVYFLSRGHLAAKVDFVFGAQQRLTFYFVNAAPQWMTFNGGNWRILEKNIRDYASNNSLDLIVYTGTYGVATLPHATTGVGTEMFLYADVNGNTAIPVPAFYWRFVYDSVNKAGAVFLGVNNPYVNTTTTICEDVSDGMKWLSWKKDDQQAGFSYACTVDDFMKVVNYLPRYDVRSILM